MTGFGFLNIYYRHYIKSTKLNNLLFPQVNLPLNQTFSLLSKRSSILTKKYSLVLSDKKSRLFIGKIKEKTTLELRVALKNIFILSLPERMAVGVPA